MGDLFELVPLGSDPLPLPANDNGSKGSRNLQNGSPTNNDAEFTPPTSPQPILTPTTKTPLTGPGVPSSLPADAQWIFDYAENRAKMFTIAQVGRRETMAELIRVAHTLCPHEWDALRQPGLDELAVAPKGVADLIIVAGLRAIRLSKLYSDPASVARLEVAVAENNSLKNELESLCHRANNAEEALRRVREQLAAEQKRNEERRQQKTKVNAERGRIQGRQERQREEYRRVEPEPVNEPAAQPTSAARMVIENPVESLEVQPNKNEERVNDLVRLIAATGICRSKEIRERLGMQWEIKQDGNVQKYIVLAVERKLVDANPIQLEYAGKSNPFVVRLTDSGISEAKRLGVTKPVESELEIGLRIHKSLPQTYAILDTADILRQLGYSSVNPFPKPLKSQNVSYHPDLTACDPLTGEIILVEYERATYKGVEGQREGKWQRCVDFGRSVIRLVTPNRDTENAVIEEIRKSRASSGEARAWRVLSFNISDHRQSGKERTIDTLWAERTVE